MKKIGVIVVLTAVIISMISCRNHRKPGRVYMPDMAYSRAYETYSSTEGLEKAGVHFTAMPVPGTIARGDMLQIYTVANDSLGYIQSNSVPNPLKIDSIDKTEAERLYLVYCGICHGSKLDGNGPLYNDGKGPFPNAPKNLVADDAVKKAGEGQYFHVMTYGKGAMGSYASQLNTTQRWMVAAYLKFKQGGGSSAKDTIKTGSSVPADTIK